MHGLKKSYSNNGGGERLAGRGGGVKTKEVEMKVKEEEGERYDEEVPPPPPLPSEEWDQVWSEVDGVYYYMNRRTQLSVWDKPAGFREPVSESPLHQKKNSEKKN